MQSINATELKSQLAHYLQQAQQGNEIIIKERNRIIARLVPPESVANFDEGLLALAAQGRVKLPKQPLTQDEVEESLKRKLPRLKVKGKAAKELIKRIWDEERGDY